MRLGVSPAATIPTDFYSQRFWDFSCLCWNPGLCGPSHSLAVPPGLSWYECGKSHLPAAAWSTQSAGRHLAPCLLHHGFPSLLLLLVWMNVSSLTSWLLDFHAVWFYGSSDCFLFLNWLLSFFWLCEEVKCIYLRLHLGQNPQPPLFRWGPKMFCPWSKHEFSSYNSLLLTNVKNRKKAEELAVRCTDSYSPSKY